jgi:hypothetical protein
VLLISLGLTVVTHPKWIRWWLRLSVWVTLISIAFLAPGMAIDYGPF